MMRFETTPFFNDLFMMRSMCLLSEITFGNVRFVLICEQIFVHQSSSKNDLVFERIRF